MELFKFIVGGFLCIELNVYFFVFSFEFLVVLYCIRDGEVWVGFKVGRSENFYFIISFFMSIFRFVF